ncbi:hypothetical protein GCM10011519_17360 [Marmoricola endophyticus]|uniref:Uncharacterized protein n=1 Tax=Marmoricola endophyticus TaxID=2040280 RepID=A0A917F517_9ACTN|nr:hypothetical protein GCM10011519_17360 [Marmoricola endophyticus]
MAEDSATAASRTIARSTDCTYEVRTADVATPEATSGPPDKACDIVTPT